MREVTRVTDIDGHRVRIAWPEGESVVSFDTSAPTRMSGETQALVAAPIAMKLGTPIAVDRPVSPGFAANFAAAQEILHGWHPSRFDVVPLHADEEEPSHPRRGTVAFFSGGVDSFYSALVRSASIDRLVLIHGFDIFNETPQARRLVSTVVGEAACEMGKPLIEVQTDLRHTTDRYMAWGRHYHAMGLAVIAHLLGAAHVIIPGTYESGNLFPWGSHPLLDPLLGSETMSVEHHGANRTRLEKIDRVVRSGVALRHLRVCLLTPDHQLNCGRCEKCIRTMLGLLAVGKLADCRSLPDTVSPDAVRRTRPRSKGQWLHATENYRRLRESGRHPEIVRALRYSRNRARLELSLRAVPGVRSTWQLVKRLAAKFDR